MNVETFCEQFATFAEAPNGVAKLSELILQIAVQGKLVPQDDNDEPASVLIERVRAALVDVIDDDQKRRVEKLRTVDADDGPFTLPSHWAWARFPELGRFGRGKSRHRPRNEPKLYANGRYPLVQTGDVARANGLIVRYTGKYNDFGLAQSRLWPAGTLCITIAANIADSGILSFEACIPDSVVGFIPSPEIGDASYFEFFIRTAKSRLEDYAPSTAQKNINLAILDSVLIPLPPLAEQRRIVAKVNQLLGMCDQLAARQAARREARERLVGATLDRLVSARSAAEFPAHAHRLRDHFDYLFDAPTTIPELRQAILKLAVQGKLVPQDPNDEPASVLLDRVAAEKTTAGIKRTGRDWVGDVAKPVEEAFVAPHGWAWTRIGNAVERVTVGFVGPMKDKYVEGGIPFLRSQNVRANRFRDEGLISISPEFHEKISKSALAPDDVVVVRSGNVGTACVIPPSLPEANCSDLVVVKKPTAVLPTYLCFYLNSLGAAHIEAGTVGVALTHFNTKSVATMPLALPPLSEQRRIVAKVTELLSLCDALEAKLTQAESASTQLLSAAVHHLLSDSTPNRKAAS